MIDPVSYVRRETTLWRDAPGGVLLLPAGRSDPVLLASPGEVVWALLAEPLTSRELIDLLARHFGTDPGIVAADLAPVLAELEALGAVERVTAPPPAAH